MQNFSLLTLELPHTRPRRMQIVSILCGLFLLIHEKHSHVPWRVLLQWNIEPLAHSRFVRCQAFVLGQTNCTTAACPWDRWQRRSLPSSSGQLSCRFALHGTWYQREFDLPHLRHSNSAKHFLQDIPWPCDPRLLADAHLLHRGPSSAEDNSLWWCLAAVFFLFSPFFLRKEDAIYSLCLREYAVWTKGLALGSAVKSVSTLLYALLHDHKRSGSYSGLRKRCNPKTWSAWWGIPFVPCGSFPQHLPRHTCSWDSPTHSYSSSILRSQAWQFYILAWDDKTVNSDLETSHAVQRWAGLTLIGEYHFRGEDGLRMLFARFLGSGNSYSCSGILTLAFLAFSNLAPSSVEPFSPQRTWKDGIRAYDNSSCCRELHPCCNNWIPTHIFPVSKSKVVSCSLWSMFLD